MQTRIILPRSKAYFARKGVKLLSLIMVLGVGVP